MIAAVLRLTCACLLISTAAAAATLSVGPGQPYTTIAAASAAAHDGDTIEIAAGTYHEAVSFAANQLTVRGVGGRPVVDMTGMAIGNGKAIFVTDGADITIDNIELVGASVTDQNGAGIRWEGPGSLTVRNCVFRSNENGILGGGAGHPENTAVIEHNEFVDNGRGNVGFTHSVYFGEADTITFRGNWSHALWPGGADIGHLFKCRAHHTNVLYNRLTAEESHSSYEINIPEGGEAYVIGNLIQQKVGGQNIMISFGDGDGTQYAGSKLFVIANTFVSEATGNATFIRTTQADAQVTVIDNLLVGAGTLTSGGVVTMMGNLATTAPGFVDPASYDYHLAAGSPAIDTGVDPGAAMLAPVLDYVHPAGTETRTTVGAAIDVGAYEFGNVPMAGDDNTPPGDDLPPATSSPTGCGCRTHDAPGVLLAGIVVAVGLGRRRRFSRQIGRDVV